MLSELNATQETSQSGESAKDVEAGAARSVHEFYPPLAIRSATQRSRYVAKSPQ